MEPFERFKKINTEGNLWIYLLILGKDNKVIEENLENLIFEKFGFLPKKIILKTVLYRLRKKGYIESVKHKGKKGFFTTEKGKVELKKMKNFLEELIQKI